MTSRPESIRTFLAAYPDRATLDRVREALAPYRERTAAIRWSPEHQLHFTLRFFGDLDPEARRKAAAVLDGLAPGVRPVLFPLNGLGAFPDWRRPRVVWAAAGAGGHDLEDLARRLDVRFGEAGLGRADKPFRTHLTVGRVRDGRRLEPDVLRDLERCPLATPAFAIDALRLMGSRLGPGGATHEELHAARLGEAS